MCYTFGLFQVSWSQVLSLIYFEVCFLPSQEEDLLHWGSSLWFILLLHGCEGDRISFIQKLPKKKLPLLLVNVSRCSLSFSSLSNKDLESHWWPFWRVLWVSDHDTSEEHTSMTLSANAEGFFKKVPGNLLRSVHLQSYITYCFSKELYWLIQCYMSIIAQFQKIRKIQLYWGIIHMIHVKNTFKWILVYPKSNFRIFSAPQKEILYLLSYSAFYSQP